MNASTAIGAATTASPATTAVAALTGLGVSATTLADVLTGVDSVLALDEANSIADGSLNISPVTLSSDWSRVVRLLMLASLAVIGSVGNVFMISAVMVEDHLKKRGNAFLVNVALADLLISGMVIPASAVLILAGQEGSPRSICNFEWTLEALCFLVTVLTLAFIAVDNYTRLCWPIERYAILTPSRVTGSVISIWLIASTLVGLQSSLELGPDLCNIDWRKPFTMTTNTNGIVSASVIVVATMIFTFLIYVCLIIRVRSTMRNSCKTSVAFNWEYELCKANMYSFFFFGIFWLPLGVVFCISAVRPVNPKLVVYLAWFALSKSCFNNLLYCIADRHFRNAYVKLFHYCCCKTTVSYSRRTRGDVRLRVHIIHSYAHSPASSRPANNRTGDSNASDL